MVSLSQSAESSYQACSESLGAGSGLGRQNLPLCSGPMDSLFQGHHSARNTSAIKHLCTQALAASKSFLPQPQSLSLIVQATQPAACPSPGDQGSHGHFI